MNLLPGEPRHELTSCFDHGHDVGVCGMCVVPHTITTPITPYVRDTPCFEKVIYLFRKKTHETSFSSKYVSQWSPALSDVSSYCYKVQPLSIILINIQLDAQYTHTLSFTRTLTHTHQSDGGRDDLSSDGLLIRHRHNHVYNVTRDPTH